MPMSYATAAAQGGLTASIYNTQSVKTPPALVQRDELLR
jgi:hypothetical protein